MFDNIQDVLIKTQIPWDQRYPTITVMDITAIEYDKQRDGDGEVLSPENNLMTIYASGRTRLIAEISPCFQDMIVIGKSYKFWYKAGRYNYHKIKYLEILKIEEITAE